MPYSDSIALAQDLVSAGKYKEALQAIHAAQQWVASERTVLAKEIEVFLLRQEAIVLDCQGETVAALGRVARARKMTSHLNLGMNETVTEQLQHIRLLRKNILSPRLSALIPPAILLGLQQEWNRQKKYLVIPYSGWASPMQLPKIYIPNLLARAWHQYPSDNDEDAASSSTPMLSFPQVPFILLKTAGRTFPLHPPPPPTIFPIHSSHRFFHSQLAPVIALLEAAYPAMLIELQMLQKRVC